MEFLTSFSSISVKIINTILQKENKQKHPWKTFVINKTKLLPKQKYSSLPTENCNAAKNRLEL